jgi:hypothetical protein
MRKLAFRLALTLALVPALVAGAAENTFSAVRPQGVAFDVIPPCRVPQNVVPYFDQKDMPVALRDLVKKTLGDLVPPDSPFDVTDVVTTGHNRRLIFIWARGHRWVLATEHGGLGYNDPIFAYELSPNGQQVTLIAERAAIPNSVCLTAEELLNQRATPASVGGK